MKIIPIQEKISTTFTHTAQQEVLMPDGWNNSGQTALLQTLKDEYILGTNEYDDLEKGQVFHMDHLHYVQDAYCCIACTPDSDDFPDTFEEFWP